MEIKSARAGGDECDFRRHISTSGPEPVVFIYSRLYFAELKVVNDVNDAHRDTDHATS